MGEAREPRARGTAAGKARRERRGGARARSGDEADDRRLSLRAPAVCVCTLHPLGAPFTRSRLCCNAHTRPWAYTREKASPVKSLGSVLVHVDRVHSLFVGHCITKSSVDRGNCAAPSAFTPRRSEGL